MFKIVYTSEKSGMQSTRTHTLGGNFINKILDYLNVDVRDAIDDSWSTFRLIMWCILTNEDEMCIQINHANQQSSRSVVILAYALQSRLTLNLRRAMVKWCAPGSLACLTKAMIDYMSTSEISLVLIKIPDDFLYQIVDIVSKTLTEFHMDILVYRIEKRLEKGICEKNLLLALVEVMDDKYISRFIRKSFCSFEPILIFDEVFELVKHKLYKIDLDYLNVCEGIVYNRTDIPRPQNMPEDDIKYVLLNCEIIYLENSHLINVPSFKNLQDTFHVLIMNYPESKIRSLAVDIKKTNERDRIMLCLESIVMRYDCNELSFLAILYFNELRASDIRIMVKRCSSKSSHDLWSAITNYIPEERWNTEGMKRCVNDLKDKLPLFYEIMTEGQWHDDAVLYESATCCICMDLLYTGDLARTKCCHLIHDECLRRWTNESRSCPYCNQSF